MSANKSNKSTDFRPQALEAHAARVDEFANSRETLEFFVKGRAKEPYRVVFALNGNNLTAHCTCPACLRGYYCKHRVNLLLGSTAGLVHCNEGDLGCLRGWLSGSDVEGPLEEYLIACGLVDDKDSELTKAKRKLAKAMKN